MREEEKERQEIMIKRGREKDNIQQREETSARDNRREKERRREKRKKREKTLLSANLKTASAFMTLLL